MNAGGDMSSKTGSIEIKSYEKSLNWFMRVKLIYRSSAAYHLFPKHYHAQKMFTRRSNRIKAALESTDTAH